MAGVRVTIELKDIDAYIKKNNEGHERVTTPDEEDVIQYWGGLLLTYIKNQWPIDTGTSRDRWTIELDSRPGNTVFFIENPMYYASFVHRAGAPPEPPLWRELLPQAWALFKLPLNQAAYRAIDKTVEEIRARQAAGSGKSFIDLLVDQISNPKGTDYPSLLMGGG